VRRLDRVVSLADYEAVALGQGGVLAARAQLVAGPSGTAVVLTIAPAADAPPDLADRVAGAAGPVSASGLPVRVVAARPAAVGAALEVVTAAPHAAAAVRAAVDGLAAPRPGARLTSAAVVAAAAAAVPGGGVTLTRWGRRGRRWSAAGSMPAAPAAWPRGSARPQGAELLALDAASVRVTVTVPEAAT
jgi:hypothetical protein